MDPTAPTARDAGKHGRRRAALLGTLLVFAAGGVAHFVYEWSGRSAVAAVLFPVNESVWEHTKLAIWPGLLVLVLQRHRLGAALPRPGLAFAAYLLTAPPLVVLLYYAYTGALGGRSLAADLGVFALAVLAGQLAAMHVGGHGAPSRRTERVGWLVVVVVAVVSIAWTFHPPHVPLFRDGRDGRYGRAR